MAQLIVENAQSCDSGEYSCVVSNNHDRITTSGYLTVYTSPIVFGAKRPNLSSSLFDGLKSTGFDRLYVWTGDGGVIRRYGDKYGISDDRRWSSMDEAKSTYPKHPKFVTGVIADDMVTHGGTISLQVRVQGTVLLNYENIITKIQKTRQNRHQQSFHKWILPTNSNFEIYVPKKKLTSQIDRIGFLIISEVFGWAIYIILNI